jgi:UDP-sugar transporter A1/2/3
MILLCVPATVYNIQQTLEYVALSNIDASAFSVLVQTKLLATAIFAVVLMGRKLNRAQTLSLTLLTTGVMLCNMKTETDEDSKYYR